MTELIAGLVGLVAGGAIGGLAAALAVRGRSGRQRAESERRLATSEAVVGELRAAVEAARDELGEARTTLYAEQTARVRAETELREAARNLQEQKALLADAERKLTDTFKALSSDALKANAAVFAERAGALVQPLRESLGRYEEHVRALELKRAEAYSKLQEQL
jgi:DNA recombination protein RmuC